MPSEFTLRIRGFDEFTISEQKYRAIENDLMQRRDILLRAGDYVFNARNFISSRKRWIPEKPTNIDIPEISEEQRQLNLRRLRWSKRYILHKRKDTAGLPEEEWEGFRQWVAWYESPEQRDRRTKRKAFRKEFFDVHFASHEEEDACFTSWSKATAPEADPRMYFRQDHTPEALGLRR